MTVTHTGSTRKYSENWERVFGKSQKSSRSAKKSSTGGGKKKKSVPARKTKGTRKAKKR